MNFIEFKIQNIQHEINDLNKFILQNKNEIEKELTHKIVDDQAILHVEKQGKIIKKLDKQKSKELLLENNISNQEVNDKQKSEKSNNNKKIEKQSSEEIKKSKSWADIVEDDEKSLMVRYNKLNEDYKKLQSNIDLIFHYLNFQNKSKYIKFNFSGNVITWKLVEDHAVNKIIKIILNPIQNNKDIYQIFYYHLESNELGIYIKNQNNDKVFWYPIDFKERVIKYDDYYQNTKFVYYNFILIEKSQ